MLLLEIFFFFSLYKQGAWKSHATAKRSKRRDEPKENLLTSIYLQDTTFTDSYQGWTVNLLSHILQTIPQWLWFSFVSTSNWGGSWYFKFMSENHQSSIILFLAVVKQGCYVWDTGEVKCQSHCPSTEKYDCGYRRPGLTQYSGLHNKLFSMNRLQEKCLFVR